MATKRLERGNGYHREHRVGDGEHRERQITEGIEAERLEGGRNHREHGVGDGEHRERQITRESKRSGWRSERNHEGFREKTSLCSPSSALCPLWFRSPPAAPLRFPREKLLCTY